MRKTIFTFTALFLTVFGALNAQVTNGLVAKYSFNNGNANDEAGTNNGTVNGATLATDRFGNAGKAYAFDGQTSNIDLGASMMLKPAAGSISVWISMVDTSLTGNGYSYNPVILAKNDSAGSSFFEGYGLYVHTSDSKLLSITTQSMTANERYIFSANSIAKNTWYHLVMTYDNDSLAFYIDGQLDNKIAKGFASTFSATEPVYVGKSGNLANNRFFHGSIDDIRIYDRVLTAEEVNSLFQDPNPVATAIDDNSGITHLNPLYPNPTKNAVHFPVRANAVLTSVTGSVLAETRNAQSLDLSAQPSGIYFITLTDNKGQVLQRSKVVKE